MSTEEIQLSQARLEELRVEHRDLDQVITRLIKERDVDQYQLQRMKKRKLHLKDQIIALEHKLVAH